MNAINMANNHIINWFDNSRKPTRVLAPPTDGLMGARGAICERLAEDIALQEKKGKGY